MTTINCNNRLSPVKFAVCPYELDDPDHLDRAKVALGYHWKALESQDECLI